MASAVKKASDVASKIIVPHFHSQKVGVVVSAGKMSKAVKVRVAEQEWNKKFRKHFPSPTTYLVRDPNASLVEGDVVRITSGFRTSRAISHVVTSIVAPFGKPVEERPPVLSIEQLDEQRVQQRLLKDVRSAQRGRQASIARLAQATKLGVKVPSVEEAMAGQKAFEKELAERLAGEAHKGQAGQERTKEERRKEAGKKTRGEVKAEANVKQARKQIVS